MAREIPKKGNRIVLIHNRKTSFPDDYLRQCKEGAVFTLGRAYDTNMYYIMKDGVEVGSYCHIDEIEPYKASRDETIRIISKEIIDLSNQLEEKKKKLEHLKKYKNPAEQVADALVTAMEKGKNSREAVTGLLLSLAPSLAQFEDIED